MGQLVAVYSGVGCTNSSVFNSHSYFYERLYADENPAYADFDLVFEDCVKTSDTSMWWAGHVMADASAVVSSRNDEDVEISGYLEYKHGEWAVSSVSLPGTILPNFQFKPTFEILWGIKNASLESTWTWMVSRPCNVNEVQWVDINTWGARGTYLPMLQGELSYTKKRRWKNSVTQTRSGIEQRVDYLPIVQRGLTLKVMSYDEVSRTRERMYTLPMLAVVVPEWPDYVEIAEECGYLDPTVKVEDDLDYRPFTVGDFIMLFKRDGTRVHASKIDDITDDIITLADGPGFTFSYADYAVPARVYLPTSSVYDEFARGNYIECKMDFDQWTKFRSDA